MDNPGTPMSLTLPLISNLPWTAGTANSTVADIYIIDYSGSGLTVTCAAGNTHFPSGGASLTNSAAPAAGDYIHLIPLAQNGEWLMLNSRGGWL